MLMDQTIFLGNHGIGNKSDEEVLKIAADDTAFINALFAFYLTTASDSDVCTIKKSASSHSAPLQLNNNNNL